MAPNPNKESCFSIDTKVNVQGGTKMMKELKEGELILSFKENGERELTEVYVQTHKNMVDNAIFCEITTWSKRLTITPKHFVVVKDGDDMINKMAQDVQVGDVVFVLTDEGHLEEEAVMTTDYIEGTGYCNFFTMSGRLIADGILCSSYAEVDPSIVHPLLAPLRTAYSNPVTKSLASSLMVKNSEGKPYVCKAVSTVLKPLISGYYQ